MKAYIRSGELSAGHARMLVGQPNADELADDIVKRGLNVRQVEALARKDGRAQARGVKGKARPRPARMPTPRHWSGACRMRSGLT